ncbi:MAG: T9SS type A sorting domain-containing protein [Bacteroidales bacterium]|nr:T9SS type A sorting domain-containing protein [Bacteroidales bacterium]
MIINANGFKHNKVEIFNEQEKLVLGRATNSEEQLNIQLNLVRGVYIVKLSSDNRSLVQKIVVEN